MPLDPVSWSVLQRCRTHRQTQRTDNPHVIGTRLVTLVTTIDATLVAAAFGINPEAVLPYLADHVDPTRAPNTGPRTRA